MTRRLLLRGAALALAIGCGGRVATSGPSKVDIPVADGTHSGKRAGSTASRQSAPASGVAKESPFPKIARFTLRNGLNVAVVTSRALPVVQARVLVRAGSGDGATPALATLTGDMLKDGGTRALSSAELVRRIYQARNDLGTLRRDLHASMALLVSADTGGQLLAVRALLDRTEWARRAGIVAGAVTLVLASAGLVAAVPTVAHNILREATRRLIENADSMPGSGDPGIAPTP